MISAVSIFRRFSSSRSARTDWRSATDEELAIAARSHDRPGKEAFVEIVRRHQTPVCAVAFSVTGRIGLTDDIAQETFLKAWKHLSSLREPAKLKAWLSRIARDCAVDALRREKPHTSLDGECPREIIASDSPPDACAADAEDAELVWSALAELPETVRTPLVLFYREGQSIAAVAAALDVSEDAIKQRLSRGRNQLREQVTAKIEGVLGRARPSALLVITIASAIGLLTAPAALAAGAVTAAAAGTAATGSATATASTFSTAMTASTYVIATITMAAFIPLGWKARESQPQSAPPARTASAKPAQPADPMAAFANSPLLAEWRRLHEVHGTGAEAMPELYKSIAEIKNPFHRRAFRSALLAEWAAVDPAGAFQNLLTQKQADHAAQLIGEWLKLQPAAAAAFLSANTKGFESGAAVLLGDIAKAAPQELAAIVQQLKAPSRWDTRVTDAFATYAMKDIAAARAAAESVTGVSRLQALSGVASGWAESNGPAALAWSRTLPEGPERDGALQNTLMGWAKSDPMAALDNVDAAPPGGEDHAVGVDTASRLLRAAAEKDMNATLVWLEKNPGKVGNDSWYGLTSVIGDRLAADPAAALTFLSSQPDSLKRGLKVAWDSVILNEGYAYKDAIREWVKQQPKSDFVEGINKSLLHSAGWKEPALALEWMKQMPDADFNDGNIREYVSDLLNNGINANRIDDTLNKVPEKMRQQTLEAAFYAESDWKDGDMQAWLGRVKDLPPERQGSALASVASRMAATNPDAAVAWVSSYAFPDEASRASALNSAVSRWAKADSLAASQWISALPRGEQRNTAAMALINSIAVGDPSGAWTWAESLDSGGRVGGMVSIVNQVKSTDPQMARQLIDGAKLDAETRSFLLNRLSAENNDGSTPRPR
ncbi:MAG TPA: sigma-70 family RNA polymerase sigma factor [Verrucomicrobiales bacterium]|nr:sigma-70 family RNA polymerase sigma factor [Verrucomicrobiales bacterium]